MTPTPDDLAPLFLIEVYPNDLHHILGAHGDRVVLLGEASFRLSATTSTRLPGT